MRVTCYRITTDLRAYDLLLSNIGGTCDLADQLPSNREFGQFLVISQPQVPQEFNVKLAYVTIHNELLSMKKCNTCTVDKYLWQCQCKLIFLMLYSLHPWWNIFITCVTAKEPIIHTRFPAAFVLIIFFAGFVLIFVNFANMTVLYVIHCAPYISRSCFYLLFTKDSPYLASKGDVWGIVRECKTDQCFIIIIVMLSALSYHI